MKLFVGLGNPGAKYAGNRHNVGFMAVDRIAADHGFAPWRARFQGMVSEGGLGGERLVLLKPGTFMNLSGQSVAEALRFYKLTPDDLTVFHDDLDLAPGKIRCKSGGGHAGHNGLRSVHGHVGEAYHRVRLGIGHPGHKDAVANYVLHDFAKADQDWLEPLLSGISEAAALLAAGDAARFLNAVALRTGPLRPAATARPPAAVRPEAGTADRALPTDRRGPDAAAAPTPTPAPDRTDRRPALQRLLDRFR